jgi:hypothetical protein
VAGVGIGESIRKRERLRYSHHLGKGFWAKTPAPPASPHEKRENSGTIFVRSLIPNYNTGESF